MVYPDNFEYKSGFDKIRALVCNYCLFEPGKEQVEKLQFSSDYQTIVSGLKRVEEFRGILLSGTAFPIDNFIDISSSLKKARVEGSFLEEGEVSNIRKAIDSVRGILNFLKNDREEKFPGLRELAGEVKIVPAILERINMILNKHGKVKDNASKELQEIRKELSGKEASISRKLNQILQKARRDGLVEEGAALTIRNGRAVIPVSAGYKRQIPGYVHDESGTGKTAYIEPIEVVEANNELKELEYSEKREVVRILMEFTTFLRPYIDELKEMHQFLSVIDSIRARAKFAIQINAALPKMTNNREMDWRNAMHPLLFISLKEMQHEAEMVPLNIRLNADNRILLISGPNAGGKSVCLQTAGLLQYMLQCGFLVPMDKDSVCGIFDSFFLDIGDEQSIENDLSTYSSHLLNMKQFLRNADQGSLVLIDEFGSGTEPLLGGAIAESVLENLNGSGCHGVITTHYTNLKHFASSAPGIINGAMLFDTARLEPLFKLDIGRPGSSFAFEIARKIGLPENILQRAQQKAGRDHIDFDKHLRDLIRDKKYWENKRQKIRVSEKRLRELVEKYSTELEDTHALRKKIISEAKEQAEKLLSETNRKIEKTIREIRESEAEKEKTKQVRKELEEFRAEIGAEEENRTQEATRLRELKENLEKAGRHNERLKKMDPDRVQKTKKEITDKVIRKGDYVLMTGQVTPGEVCEIRGKSAMVAFGDIFTVVDQKALEKISREDFLSKRKFSSSRPSSEQWSMGKKRLSFSPSIDVRGKRADEALRSIMELLDDAVMFQSRELRILHGKGNGILRELIRQYLATQEVVASFRDEHVERGGSGITLISLDI